MLRSSTRAHPAEALVGRPRRDRSMAVLQGAAAGVAIVAALLLAWST
jgi:hypothetical protein